MCIRDRLPGGEGLQGAGQVDPLADLACQHRRVGQPKPGLEPDEVLTVAFPPRRDGIAVEDRADESVRMLVAEPVPPQRELDEGLLQQVLGQVCVCLLYTSRCV